MSEFKVGDPVLLTLDSPGDLGITNGLKRYKDRRFRISRVGTIAPKTGSPCIYYELDGCVSEKGVPYSVTEDWIQPIRELKR